MSVADPVGPEPRTPVPPVPSLLSAYRGYYEVSNDKALEIAAGHTPSQRLSIYLEWTGIIGYAEIICRILEVKHDAL